MERKFLGVFFPAGKSIVIYARAAVFAFNAVLWSHPAHAQVLALRTEPVATIDQTAAAASAQGLSGAPANTADVATRLRRQIVDYPTAETPGTVIVDTPNTYLYLVLGGGKAVRYGIGVGREGFTWSGTKTIERKAEWPDWLPPVEMLQRQPYLPRFMAGGPGNPLGARAMYLGGTIYRIHGTNNPSTIGKQVSSGCIRMVNEDVIDLYARVRVGTKVVVLPMRPSRAAHAPTPIARIATRGAIFNESMR
jgi:lipoprotein-anchoring transpeptidase ErfK/SrfK